MPFQKGHKFGKGRIKGSKNKTTLLKEERRSIFENRVSQKWEKTIDKLKPEYVADQFMGKAPDEVHTTTVISFDSAFKPDETSPKTTAGSEEQGEV